VETSRVIGNFNDRVKEIHASLDAHGIPHAFGGAIALIYGVNDPRLTHDIDLNISVPPARVDEVLAALPSTLRPSAGDAEAVRRHGQVRLHWGPDLPVDLFFPQHEFHGIVASRTRLVTFNGEPLPVISPTDLTVFKTMFNRRKDWADIEAMLRAGTVDEPEALRWIRVILGRDHPSCSHLAALMTEVHDQPERTADGDPNVWRRGRV
jgi:hypothetical protein